MSDKTMTPWSNRQGCRPDRSPGGSVPRSGNNEVLIEVKAAGICGTDLHIYHDEFPYWPPVILGHEFAGGRGGSRQ